MHAAANVYRELAGQVLRLASAGLDYSGALDGFERLAMLTPLPQQGAYLICKIYEDAEDAVRATLMLWDILAQRHGRTIKQLNVNAICQAPQRQPHMQLLRRLEALDRVSQARLLMVKDATALPSSSNPAWLVDSTGAMTLQTQPAAVPTQTMTAVTREAYAEFEKQRDENPRRFKAVLTDACGTRATVRWDAKRRIFYEKSSGREVRALDRDTYSDAVFLTEVGDAMCAGEEREADALMAARTAANLTGNHVPHQHTVRVPKSVATPGY